MSEPGTAAPSLRRALTTRDGVLLTVGSVVGTGIFLTGSEMARSLPHAGLLLLAWAGAGLLTLAGAATYAELGVLFPRAGGLYNYLAEAWGPLAGFLYGWAGFLVLMSGGIAAIAVGFGATLGGFVPFFSTDHVLLSASIGPVAWRLTGAQAAGAAAILLLTGVNLRGLSAGARTQRTMTLVTCAALAVFVVAGLLVAREGGASIVAPLPAIPGAGAFAVATVAALWTFDGWYGLTLSAGEVADPARTLPRGLIGGVALVLVLYLALQLVYVRALSIPEMIGASRVGEAAATSLFGGASGRTLGLVVLGSSLGCLAANVLYASRLYAPMAEDGLFFRSVARIDPVTRVPSASLKAQGLWSAFLALSGSYDQLYTYAVFGGVLFHAATAAGLFALRRKRPDLPRPYRAWGYPLVPGLFVAASVGIAVLTLVERPVESLAGLGLIAAGLPAYAFWRSSRSAA